MAALHYTHKLITTTADAGAGSLRDALDSTYPVEVRFLGGVALGDFEKATALVRRHEGLRMAGPLDYRGRRPGQAGKPIRPNFRGLQMSQAASHFNIRRIAFWGDETLGTNARALMIGPLDASQPAGIGLGELGPGTVASCTFVSGGPETVFVVVGRVHDLLVEDCSLDGSFTGLGMCAHVAGIGRVLPDFDRATVFRRCSFKGLSRVPDLNGGVHFFYDCDFTIAALGGPRLAGARAAFYNCRFHTIPQPPGTSYWYSGGIPWPIVVTPWPGSLGLGIPADADPLPECVWTQGCSLDGVPKSTRELVWDWVVVADGTAPVQPARDWIFRKHPFPGRLR